MVKTMRRLLPLLIAWSALTQHTPSNEDFIEMLIYGLSLRIQ
jgi:hypothetical protein